jgi:uncharacterized protein (DUF2252 family)
VSDDPAALRKAGKAARERAARSAHAAWEPGEHRPDPVALLQNDDEGRLPQLLPIRYFRMLQSPFTFYRGAASIMACDLQCTPASGIATQIGGDAHLLNFGAFGTPERRFVFDVNDFDETTTGAWEWDIKRLATSVEIAARHLKLRARDARDAVLACAASYRTRMHEFADKTVLDTWYARIDETVLADIVRGADARKRANGASDAKERQADAHAFPAVARAGDGTAAIVDTVPKVFHPANEPQYEPTIRGLFEAYAKTLPEERRRLFARYRFVDAAYKVVGVGSVGTRCSVALFVAGAGDELWLQVKEARASVYERYAESTPFADHGDRVVTGQRLMQSASDVFLGYARGDDGRAFYVRQLRDMKTSPNVDRMTANDLLRYAEVCAWALARAHARASGAPAAIAGYLGRGDAFDQALAAFADAYADQNEADYAALQAAHADGRIAANPNGGFTPAA